MLYKISEFSNITKISARMIRYFDREGILKPKVVDENGYRYYSEFEMERASKICRLRKYHFSYQEIKDILAKQLEDDVSLYKEKLQSLKEVVQDYEVLIDEIEKLVAPTEVPILNSYTIQRQMRKPYFALTKTVRMQMNEIEAFVEEAVTAVQHHCSCALIGNYYISFYGDDLLTESYTDESVNEIGFFQPIAESIEIPEFITVQCEEELVLSTIHYGAYDQLYHAYLALFHAIKQEGYVGYGPYSEKYFVDSYFTKDPNEYITEISIRVIKSS